VSHGAEVGVAFWTSDADATDVMRIKTKVIAIEAKDTENNFSLLFIHFHPLRFFILYPTRELDHMLSLELFCKFVFAN
jgi:hypothetical protein